MAFIIFLFVILGIIFFRAVIKNMRAEEGSSTYDKSSTYSAINVEEDPVERDFETIDRQSILQSLACYCGAVNAIRSANTWRDDFQHGMFSIEKREDGRYKISCIYDHSSDYNVRHALERGGYLKYLGINYQEDGFAYNLDGIPASTEFDAVFSVDAVTAALNEYMDGSIVVEHSWKRENTVYVNFKIV